MTIEYDDKGKKFTDIVTKRPVYATVQTTKQLLRGNIHVRRDQRIKDELDLDDKFIAITDVSILGVAGTIAVAQFDIKKVLAYSTVSQLGFMVSAVGMGAVAAGVFHLKTHAFFKALLFLSSGSVIHGVEHGHHHVAHKAHEPDDLVAHANASGHEDASDHGDHSGQRDDHPAEKEFDPQDMRNMGGLWNRQRTTASVYLIGALALMGIFPLAGFWSKDEILLKASQQAPIAFVMRLSRSR